MFGNGAAPGEVDFCLCFSDPFQNESCLNREYLSVMKGKNGNLCLSDCILMACAIFFKSFRGAERANPTQSRGNARLCSIAGLVAWLVEIPSGLGSLGENKALKNSKAFLHMCSPPLPPPCCCFSSQSSCERLPLKVKLGLERSSAGAVSPPASSLFPPEVTQGGTASLPPLPG